MSVLQTAAAYKVLKGDSAPSDNPKSTNLKESIFNKPLTWAVIIGAAGYVIYRAVKSTPKKQGEQALEKDIKETEKKQVLSYPLSNYSGFADKIFTSFSGNYNIFDRVNEEPIYDVMKAMNNDLDVLQLVKAFGKRREPTALFGAFTADQDLNEWLTTALDQDEMDMVNSILMKKGIKYKF